MIEIVHHIHERLSLGDVSVFAEHLTDDYARHCQAMPPGFEEIRGHEQLAEFLVEHFDAIPDWTDTIDFVLVDGDRIGYQVTSRGTQTGALGPFPASNRSFELVNMVFHRFEGERIAETWVLWDNLSMFTQLGHMAPPG
jgi:predicted ester cyclase